MCSSYLELQFSNLDFRTSISVREQSTLDLFVDLRVSEVSRLFPQRDESLDLLVDHLLELVAVCCRKEEETRFHQSSYWIQAIKLRCLINHSTNHHFYIRKSICQTLESI